MAAAAATEDELKAGEYIASQLAKFHIQPAGDVVNGKKGYIETVPVMKQEFSAPPTLKAGSWTVDPWQEIAVTRAGSANMTGPLQVMKPGDKVEPGAIVYLHLGTGDPRAQMMSPLQAGAAGLIVADSEALRTRFQRAAGQLPGLPVRVGNAKSSFERAHHHLSK